jgi:hypothetical protein
MKTGISMKKLTIEEGATLFIGKTGRDSVLRKWLLELKPGEVLQIEKEDWQKKNTPYYIIARLKKTANLRFEYKRTLSGGWIFRRLA